MYKAIFSLILTSTILVACSNGTTRQDTNPRHLYALDDAISIFNKPGSKSAQDIHFCGLNAEGGVGTCATLAAPSQKGIMFSFEISHSNKYMYLPVIENDGILKCHIVDGNLTHFCEHILTQSVKQPLAIALNANDTKAYITQNNVQQIMECDANTNDGNIANCKLTPNTVNLSKTSEKLYISKNHLYSINFNGHTINNCTINSNHDIQQCAQTNFSNHQVADISINTDNNLAYLTTQSGDLLQCPIDNGGTILEHNCTQLNKTDGLPEQSLANFTLSANNQIAYVGTFSESGIYMCQLSHAGDITSCKINNINIGPTQKIILR